MEDDLQLIERKLAGELAPDEETRFAQRLSQDPEFAEQYALGKVMIQALREEALKEEMRTWIQKRPLREQQQKFRWQYGMAAGLALLVVALAGLWYLNRSSESPQSLYETYYTVYPADPVLRGEPTVDYSQAMDLYRQGRYQEAIPLFEALRVDDASDRWIALFLGNSYLNVNQTDTAIRYFTQVATTNDAIVRRYGQWYLALSYLKTGDPEAARPWLQQLSKEEGMFQNQAQAMIKAL